MSVSNAVNINNIHTVQSSNRLGQEGVLSSGFEFTAST